VVSSLAVDVRLHRGAFALDVRFEIQPGITVLFGRSGSGKSSTLAAIAGLLDPEGGRIVCGGETWFDASARLNRPVHERALSFVFQSSALFPHMNAAHNVAFGIPRSVPQPERHRRALEMLERMKVGYLASRRPSTFSGGEAQRVALARAFVRQPRVVLLDEPFSAMDRGLRRELWAEVGELVRAQGVPALLVTHHRAEARNLAERAVVLEGGHVSAHGATREVLPPPGDWYDEEEDEPADAPAQLGRVP
jgi:molybdate transport system ATP-binding protein